MALDVGRDDIDVGLGDMDLLLDACRGRAAATIVVFSMQGCWLGETMVGIPQLKTDFGEK